MSDGIYLLLGSNLGDKMKNLAEAEMHIRKIATVKKQSSYYVSQAWGLEDQPDFINQVLEISSELDPSSLLEYILGVENKMGRQRTEKWGTRLIDIDILFYGSQTIHSNRLTIPHPEIQNRKFTLLPLNEIAPDLVHPVLGKTISALTAECTDHLKVWVAGTEDD